MPQVTSDFAQTNSAIPLLMYTVHSAFKQVTLHTMQLCLVLKATLILLCRKLHCAELQLMQLCHMHKARLMLGI